MAPILQSLGPSLTGSPKPISSFAPPLICLANWSLKIRFTIDFKILEHYSRTTKFFFSYSFRNNLIRDLFYVPPANELFNLEDQFKRFTH